MYQSEGYLNGIFGPCACCSLGPARMDVLFPRRRRRRRRHFLIWQMRNITDPDSYLIWQMRHITDPDSFLIWQIVILKNQILIYMHEMSY